MRRHSNKRTRTSVTRRSQVASISVMILLAGLGACTGGDEPSPTAATGETASPGQATAPEIPKATVSMAMFPCCADSAFFAIPPERQFFQDVGITIDPPDLHYYTAFDQIVPAMQRGDFDVSVFFLEAYFANLNTFAPDIPPIMLFDVYLGYSILKAPDNPAKTTLDFVDEGLPFEEAAAKATEQLRGQTIFMPATSQTQPPYIAAMLGYGDVTPDDYEVKFLDDPDIIALATTPGRVEWAVPFTAPGLVQMLRDGFEPVIDVSMMLENAPDSAQAQEMMGYVGYGAVIAQRDWIEGNHDTALRLLSASFRMLDYLEDPATRDDGLEITANVINATQGLKLTPEDIGGILDNVDPPFSFDQQGPELWDDPNAPFHAPSSVEVQVQQLIDNGTLPDQDYNLDDFLVAQGLYQELKALQDEADGLFAEAETSGVTGDLVDQAHQYYDWFDYLDAVSFLKAALGKT